MGSNICKSADPTPIAHRAWSSFPLSLESPPGGCFYSSPEMPKDGGTEP